MKNILALAAALMVTACFAPAQDMTGDWHGTLKAGPAELRLVLHITKSADGTLQGSMDSIDQGANGIPLTSVAVKESKLTFTIPAVFGSYEGKLSADGTTVAGTWNQGQPMPLDFQRTIKTEAKPIKPADIVGAWLGTLNAGAVKLRVAFHFAATETGLSATMDSLDQNAKGIPVGSVTLSGDSVSLEVPKIAGKFEGRFSSSTDTIDGTWSQGSGKLPLSLKRVKDAAALELKRPQNPVKPYPYREEEVSFENKTAGIKLAGTLTVPPGNGPFPAALLITGSGPQDRDESLMGHRPFLVLADHLTRKGIAVLRVDDRGVGKSGGNFATATTADFATDTEAGLAYLMTRPEVDAHKIGLIGHSEGGAIAPMVAARNPNVAFIVLMAGPGVSGEDIIVEQAKSLAQASGAPADHVQKIGMEQREVLEIVKAEPDNAIAEKKVREKLSTKVSEGQLGPQIKALTSPWYRYFLAYDPAPSLSKVHCPVLAINGEKDLQVPPKQNLPAIRKALVAGGNKDFELVEFPGLNHLFQTAKTGLVSEYGELEETISPAALEKMSTWIARYTGAAAGVSPTGN